MKYGNDSIIIFKILDNTRFTVSKNLLCHCRYFVNGYQTKNQQKKATSILNSMKTLCRYLK